MNTARFRHLTTARGPFASVYINDSRDSADADVELDAIWRDVCRQLDDNGADRRTIDHIERAILHSRPAVGRQGRGIIATPAGILINKHLHKPPTTTVVRASDYPYVMSCRWWMAIGGRCTCSPRSTMKALKSRCTATDMSTQSPSTGAGTPCTNRPRPGGTGTATISTRPRRPFA